MALETIKCTCDAGSLLARIDALAAHVAAAHDGDHVKDLAASIGEIDLAADTEILTHFQDGTVQISIQPRGNLVRLLDAYERGVAQ